MEQPGWRSDSDFYLVELVFAASVALRVDEYDGWAYTYQIGCLIPLRSQSANSG